MLNKKSIAGALVAASTAFSAMSASSVANAEEIYFIRGAMDVFSAGMNQMTKKLKARGLRASVHSNGAWKGLAQSIIKRSKSGNVSYPIIIAGHSVGGQEAPKFSNTLARAGIPVKLVIGIDPGWATPPKFTAGSPRVVDFWVGGTSRGNPYKSGGSFSGTIQNVDIRSFSNADHVQIDKDAKVQARILGLVMGAL